jgi:carbamate kinase
MTVEMQRNNIRIAAKALAPIAEQHKLVLSHGNGPQVGLLALQQAAYQQVAPYPFDVLGAQTEGMIGYMIEQELGNLLPFNVPFATVLTMVEVDPNDPAFANPTKFIGPVYSEDQLKRMTEEKGWTFKKDGDVWRRVVPSPMPKRIFEIRPIQWLLERGTIVICAGGGGIPTYYEPGKERSLVGVEAVIDKDLASALLAKQLNADLLVIATDADGIYLNYKQPDQKKMEHTTPHGLSLHLDQFPAGSMGPKVQAAMSFVEESGNCAAIGSLADLEKIVAREAGTIVEPDILDF